MGVWLPRLEPNNAIRMVIVWGAAIALIGGLLPSAAQQAAYTAKIILHTNTAGRSTRPVWCSRSSSAYLYGQGVTLFRMNLDGKVEKKLDASDTVSDVLCSKDGNVIDFINPAADKLSIYDQVTDELSEYAITPPSVIANARSLMSPEGDAFALPAETKLTSGPDFLANKKIVRIGQEQAYWTKDILFVSEREPSAFRMLRRNNFTEIGVLRLNAKRAVQGIFACGKSYFVLYWADDLQRNIFEPINDKSLEAGTPTRVKFDNVGAVDQWSGVCTVPVLQNVGSSEQLNAVAILGDGTEQRVDLHDYDRVARWFSTSPDRRMLLGTRGFGTTDSVIVLQIEK